MRAAQHSQEVIGPVLQHHVLVMPSTGNGQIMPDGQLQHVSDCKQVEM